MLSTATVAGHWFEPDFASLPADWDDRVPMKTLALAQQWLVSEADNWFVALRSAAHERRLDTVISVAEAMDWFSNRWPQWGHWTEVFRLASTAAEELGDSSAHSTLLNYLSWALNICDGDSSAAVAAADHAYAVAESADNLRHQGWARLNLAQALLAADDYPAAFAAAQEAARLSQEAGDRDGVSQAMAVIGHGHEKLGHVDDALESHRQQLAAVADPATAPSPAVAAANALYARGALGRLHNGRGDWDSAILALRPAVALGETVAIPRMQALALAGLGEALCETGHRSEGLQHLRAAQSLYQRLHFGPETARLEALLGKYSVD